jgi:hypothetical protein
MKSVLILVLFMLIPIVQAEDAPNRCMVERNDPLQMITDTFNEFQNISCQQQLRDNIYPAFREMSQELFCSQFSLRSNINRQCHSHYNFTPQHDEVNNVSYRCLAGVYEGRINQGPDGVIRGHFSESQKEKNYRDKTVQLMKAYEIMVDDQVDIGTDINQYASWALIRNANPESLQYREFKCAPEDFSDIMKCDNPEANRKLVNFLSQLRRANGNQHPVDVFKQKFTDAINRIDPRQNLSPSLYSSRELQEHLRHAQIGYSFGMNYYYNDQTLFNNPTSLNLQVMQLYREYESTDALRADVHRIMDNNYRRENGANVDFPAAYIEGRDMYLDQLQQRYKLSKALLRSTQFMLNYYKNIGMNFSNGVEYDYVADHVEENVLEHIGGGITAQDLVDTGWFSMNEGKLKIDREKAFDLIDISRGENLEDRNAMVIPGNLAEFAVMWNGMAANEYTRLKERCDSFIETKENLCNVMGSNSMLMNDSAAARCLDENEEELNNQELVDLAHQYCSGTANYLFGGEPAANRETPPVSRAEVTSVDGEEERLNRVIAESEREEAVINDALGILPETEVALREQLKREMEEVREEAEQARSQLTCLDPDPAKITRVEEMERQIEELYNGGDYSLARILRQQQDELKEEVCYDSRRRATPLADPLNLMGTTNPMTGGNSRDINEYDTLGMAFNNSEAKPANLEEETLDMIQDSDRQDLVGTIDEINSKNIEEATLAQNPEFDYGTGEQMFPESYQNEDGTYRSSNTFQRSPASHSSFEGDSGSDYSTGPLAEQNTRTGDFTEIDNRINGLQSQIKASRTTETQTAQRAELEEQLAALRAEREQLETELNETDSPEAVLAETGTPTVNTRIINRGPANAPAATAEENVEEENNEQEPVRNGPVTSGPVTAAPARPTAETGGGSVESESKVIFNGTNPVINTRYGGIVLSTVNIARLDSVPSFVEAPEDLLLEELATGESVYLKVDDHTYILHRKLEDGTIFRQQVVVGEGEAAFRIPAALTTPEPQKRRRPVIRLDQIESQINK